MHFFYIIIADRRINYRFNLMEGNDWNLLQILQQMEELIDGSDAIGLFDSSKDATSLCDSWQFINFKMKETMQIKNDRPPLIAQKQNQKGQYIKQAGTIKKPIAQPKRSQKQNQIKIDYQSRKVNRYNSPFRVITQGMENRQKQQIVKIVNSSQIPIEDIKIISTGFPLKPVINLLQADGRGLRSLSKQNRIVSKDKQDKQDKDMNARMFPVNYEKSNSFNFTLSKLPNIVKKKDQRILHESRQAKIRSQYIKSQNSQIQKEDNQTNLYLNYSKSQNLQPTFTIHHSPNKSLNKFRLFGSKSRAISLQSLHQKNKIHHGIVGLHANQYTRITGVNNREGKPKIKLSFAPIITKLKIIRNQKQ